MNANSMKRPCPAASGVGRSAACGTGVGFGGGVIPGLVGDVLATKAGGSFK